MYIVQSRIYFYETLKVMNFTRLKSYASNLPNPHLGGSYLAFKEWHVVEGNELRH